MAGETIKGITVQIGADTTGLSKALSDVNKNARDIQSELRQVDKLLKLDPKNTELLAQKQQLLSDAVANTREKLDRLKTAQEQVNEQFRRGDITEGQYRAFQREVVKTEQNLADLEKQLKDAEPAAKKLGEQMEEAGKKMQAAGDKMTGAGKKLTTNVTAPILAAGGAMVAAGNAFDDAFDNIRVGTGATGDALESLKDDFRAVAAEAPASFGDVSTAIADYNTRLGIAGEGLQELSIQTLELVRITGGDLAKTIEETSQTFQAFNLPAEDYGKALDFIFLTAQSTGIGIDRMQSNMVRFSPALKQLGLDFESSATLLGQLDKAGVDVEQTLGGLTRAVATLAKDGVTDANEAIQILFDEIKNAPTDIEGTEKALETFGTRAGPALASAIREGKLEYQDLMAELQGSDETILGVADETKDWAEGFVELKNNLLLAIEPLAGQFFDAINGLIPLFQDAVAWIGSLVEWFANLDPGIQNTILIVAGLAAAIGPLLVVLGMVVSSIGALMPVLAAVVSPVGLVVAAIAGLVAGLLYLYNTNEDVRNALHAAWEWIKETAETIFGAIRDFWDEWGGTITGIFENIFEILKILWDTVFGIIRDTVMSVFNGLAAFWEQWGGTITRYFEGVWNGIKIVVETVIAVIDGIIKAFLAILKGDWEGAWDAIKGVAESIWDGIKRMFHNVKDTMASVGKDIIQGLINGVKNMASSAIQAARDVADSVAGAVKGFFGINSPSRLMMEFGENIGDGLAEGIKDSVSTVKREASALSEAANVSASGGGRGGGSIMVNVTGNTITSPADEDRLAEKISRKIASSYGHSTGGAY